MPISSLAHPQGAHHAHFAAEEPERRDQVSQLMELNEQNRKVFPGPAVPEPGLLGPYPWPRAVEPWFQAACLQSPGMLSVCSGQLVFSLDPASLLLCDLGEVI